MRVPANLVRRSTALLGALATLLLVATCYRETATSPTEVERRTAPGAPQFVNLPAGFTASRVATGFTGPTSMSVAPDGRIFITENSGKVRVFKNGALLPAPFVSFPVNSSGERGLLGVAFDPAFASNQYVYLYYTTSTAPIHNRVSRFTANGDVAVAGSELVIFELDNVSAADNHNGGALHFGPDGMLYVAVGDNANSAHSQSLTSTFGKILRINTDGSVPTDNPFYSTATGKYRAIWARGLRNPFTFAFQPGTGRMFINDVGENSREEINEGIAGANYGWPNCEGVCNPSNPTFRDPIYSYGHSGGVCAIAGGTFYNPSWPSLGANFVGKYFYADHCAGFISVLDPATNTVTPFATFTSAPVDVQVGIDGALYYLEWGNLQLWRVVSTASQLPQVMQQPSDFTAYVGHSATVTVIAGGPPPLSYQWKRNGTNITGATAASYTIASTALADNGAKFSCTITNGSGSVTTNQATLTVSNNQPPTATIDGPTAGTTYRGGQSITYGGTGTDPETGDLPGSAFTWEIVFHHDAHTHPGMQPTTGSKTGTFDVPNVGHVSETNVYYRIRLTITDPGGASTTVERDIVPEKSTFNIASNPSGAQATLDGQPITTPKSVLSVVGMQRTIGVVTPQTVNGTAYNFATWSDSGGETHIITVPPYDTTITANFVVPCSFVLSAQGTTAPPAGGAFSVDVAAGANCSWTASSNVPWVTISGTGTGEANGKVDYMVGVNAGPQRVGTLTVGGQSYTITQGTGCAYSIASAGGAFDASGGAGTVDVTAGPGCTWTATSNDAWIAVTVGGGTSSGPTTYTVAANTGTNRTGTLTVAGQTYTITQGTGCAPTLSAAPTAFAASGGPGTMDVTAGAGCTWTATSNDAWITITAGESGTSGGTTSYTVAANSGPYRTGTLTVAGQTYTVAQNSGCAYAFTPGSGAFDASGGTGTVDVAGATECPWTATSNDAWIAITAGGSGTGSGVINYTVAANTGTNRTGTLTVGGQSYTITQGTGCAYAIASTGGAFEASGGAGTVDVTAGPGCTWTATSNDAWIAVTVGGGTSSGPTTYTVAANTGTNRTGTLTVAGHTYTITQGTGCAPTLSAAPTAFAASGGPGTMDVTAGAGCTWTATSNDAWITITAGESGTSGGTTSYTVAANSGPYRTGTLTVAGQTYTVAQNSGCAYAFTPGSGAFDASGGTGTVDVAGATECPWTATSNDAWIAITAGGSGTGSGAINYTVAANTGTNRTGTLTVAGHTYTITQNSGCTYAIGPNANVAAGGGTGSIGVTAGESCAWTAVSSSEWITVTSGAGSSGNGSAGYSVAANTSGQRIGTVTVAGQTFNVTQAAAACNYGISPTNQTFEKVASSGAVGVTTGSWCNWSATSNSGWITITSGSSGTGNGSTGFSFPANAGPQRVGTLAVAGQTFTVTQQTGCTYTISPTSRSLSSASGTGTIATTAATGCSWTATSANSWISVTSGSSGNGNGSTGYSVAANTGTARNGSMTIGGQTFAVSQSGGTCTYTISPVSKQFNFFGGSGTITVTTGPSCPWTALSNAPSWITINSGASGTGTGAVSYTVKMRSWFSASRTGTITITGGNTFTVRQ